MARRLVVYAGQNVSLALIAMRQVSSKHSLQARRPRRAAACLGRGSPFHSLDADVSSLNKLGYDARLCLTDFGETAEATVAAALEKKPYECVLIGAGVRTIGKNFLLFEKLINVVHQKAPQAKICFNTKPNDSMTAVQRWV